jgi:hypothetical protein
MLTKLANALRQEGEVDESECYIDATFASAKGGGADIGKTRRNPWRDGSRSEPTCLDPCSSTHGGADALHEQVGRASYMPGDLPVTRKG